MELIEDEVNKRYAKKGLRCLRNILVPYEVAITSILCGYNVIKKKRTL